MQLCIPRIGSILILAEDWTFNLYFEHRNNSLLEVFSPDGTSVRRYYGWTEKDFEKFKSCGAELCIEKAMTESQLDRAYDTYRATNSRDNYYLKVTFPKGTPLKVDRIYIRNGVQAFDSITFRTTKDCPDKKFRSKRFWVKLNDANKICYDALI